MTATKSRVQYPSRTHVVQLTCVVVGKVRRYNLFNQCHSVAVKRRLSGVDRND